MPRRYMDYVDTMHGFNLLSSWGSLIRLCRLFHFMFILFDGFLSQRGLVFWEVLNTEREWSRKGFPIKYHNFSQNVWGFSNNLDWKNKSF